MKVRFIHTHISRVNPDKALEMESALNCFFKFIYLAFNIHFHKILDSKFSPHFSPPPTPKCQAF